MAMDIVVGGDAKLFVLEIDILLRVSFSQEGSRSRIPGIQYCDEMCR